MKTPIQEQDYFESAQLLGCDVAAIKAVAEVESRGYGFNEDGTPKTLFEGHWFSRFTKGKYDEEYPTISYPRFTKKFYGKTQEAEKGRLSLASSLDRQSALMSASWGKFQIMGFNFPVCGFKKIQDFVNAMYRDEDEHLDAFCNYVINVGLADELRDQRWDDFAYRYNGPEYQKNDYAGKLARAYIKYS